MSSEAKKTDNEAQSADLLKEFEKLEIKGDEAKEPPQVCKDVAECIQKSKKILVLTGAGVSVAAGIPDFRSPGTGLYDNLQKYNLPYPEAVFDVQFYRHKPTPFVSLAKEIWPGIKFSPTYTHSFLALLAKKGLLLRLYSQNIDGLEHLAGIPSDLLVECHGHFRTASCVQCHKKADGEATKNTILAGKAPTCTFCSSYVKPDIVFFGESLPARFHRCLKHDLAQADLLLIMGTSLQVAPVSLIPQMVECRKILFNRERVGSLQIPPDLFYAGDCDETVKTLCHVLGWDEELEQQNTKTRLSEPSNDDETKGDKSQKDEENTSK